jgi:hypothetical protein
MHLNTEPRQTLLTRGLILMMTVSTILAGCDLLQDDQETETEITLSDEAIYLTPSTSGIIDLKSLVSAGANVTLQVATQPSYGTLQSLGQDLLQYTPNNGVTEAYDGFTVAIYNATHTFIGEDSVTIIITQDSVSVPCGIWALTDYVHNVTGPVDIYVLENDTACGVQPNLLEVSIPDLEVNGAPVPKSYYGTVEVLANGAIRYTPGPDFPGHDHFIYSIRKPENVPNAGDAELIGHGYVYISGGTHCTDSLIAMDDFFTFGDSIAQVDSLYLNVIGNDIFCTDSTSTFEMTVTEWPQGHLQYAWNHGFDYTFPLGATTGFQDRFVYRICQNNNCDEAEVIIRLE